MGPLHAPSDATGAHRGGDGVAKPGGGDRLKATLNRISSVRAGETPENPGRGKAEAGES